MAGSVNSVARICLRALQKKTLSFSSNWAILTTNRVSFYSKMQLLATFSAPNPYRFPAFPEKHLFVTPRGFSNCPLAAFNNHDFNKGV